MTDSDGKVVREGTFLYAGKVPVAVYIRIAGPESADVAGKYYLDWDGAGTEARSSSVGPFDSFDEVEAFARRQTDGKVLWKP